MIASSLLPCNHSGQLWKLCTAPNVSTFKRQVQEFCCANALAKCFNTLWHQLCSMGIKARQWPKCINFSQITVLPPISGSLSEKAYATCLSKSASLF